MIVPTLCINKELILIILLAKIKNLQQLAYRKCWMGILVMIELYLSSMKKNFQASSCGNASSNQG